VHKREFVLMKTRLCAQARSCFGENPFVCTSVLIVCTRHTPLLEALRLTEIVLIGSKFDILAMSVMMALEIIF